MNNSLQKAALVGLLVAAASFPVQAEKRKALLERNQFSVGAGLSINSVGGPVDDELGFQIYGAYSLSQLNLMDGVNSSIEFGYMDYGFNGSDSDGIWGTFVVDGALGEQGHWLARLGYDIGDDNGLMLGAGLGVSMDSRTRLRLEYVIRDEIDSIQLNLLYRL